MPRVSWMRTMGIIIAGMILVGLSQATAAATRSPGAPMYQMQGKITAIDTAANTVVVEVPQEKKPFTVGGPLSPKAVVTKGGKTVSLSALRVGGHIQVHWEQMAAGHRITQLEASK
jgi:hypothetical protein